MKTFTTIEEFEEHYFPRNVERYPVVLRHRVTEEEAHLIDDWLAKRHSADMIDDLKVEIEEKHVKPKREKKAPKPKPTSKKDIIVDRLRGRYPIVDGLHGYEMVGSGEPVTVRTCSDIIEYGRTGRFTIDRKPHESLVEQNGQYLFVVIKPNGDDFDILLHRLMPAAHIIDKTNGLRIKVHPVKIWGKKACIAAGLNVVPWSSRTTK